MFIDRKLLEKNCTLKEQFPFQSIKKEMETLLFL
jgi:hypothetical protein